MISRRTFLKLMGASLLSLWLPEINTEDEMELSVIFEKIATNIRLTPQELEFFKQQGRETQKRNSQIGGWTQSDGNPTFGTPYAKDMNFDIIPLGSVFFNGTGGGQQIIPDGTHTVVGNATAAEINVSTNKYFHTSTDNSKLYIDKTPFRVFIYGHASFASNATGYRGMRLYYYNSDGTENRFRPLVRVPAVNGNNTNWVFCASAQIFENLRVGDYFSFTVYQNCGIDLALEDFGYGAFAIA